jgi:2-polyprenyl-3-methyl-5-hydroxy-6-metoxy-1,4-benzoquinol methylase
VRIDRESFPLFPFFTALALPAMPSRAYHESLWEAIPEGLAPSDARLREAFLAERVTNERKMLGRAPRVLDLGCAEGHFAGALAKGGAELVAVDVAEEPVRRARASHPGLDVRLVEPESPLPFEGSSFDVVWAGETIEHVADTGQWLSEVRRVLRSGAILLLSTPDHGLLSRLRLASSEQAFAAHFDPRSDHLRFYTRRGLVELLEDFGFAEVAVARRGGLPGARSVLLASGRRTRF